MPRGLSFHPGCLMSDACEHALPNHDTREENETGRLKTCSRRKAELRTGEQVQKLAPLTDSTPLQLTPPANFAPRAPAPKSSPACPITQVCAALFPCFPCHDVFAGATAAQPAGRQRRRDTSLAIPAPGRAEGREEAIAAAQPTFSFPQPSSPRFPPGGCRPSSCG